MSAAADSTRLDSTGLFSLLRTSWQPAATAQPRKSCALLAGGGGRGRGREKHAPKSLVGVSLVGRSIDRLREFSSRQLGHRAPDDIGKQRVVGQTLEPKRQLKLKGSVPPRILISRRTRPNAVGSSIRRSLFFVSLCSRSPARPPPIGLDELGDASDASWLIGASSIGRQAKTCQRHWSPLGGVSLSLALVFASSLAASATIDNRAIIIECSTKLLSIK